MGNCKSIKCKTRIAELEAENERLTKLLGDAQQALRNEIIAHGNTIRARTGAVKKALAPISAFPTVDYVTKVSYKSPTD